MASVSKRQWTHKGVTKEAWTVRYLDPATGSRPSKQFDTKKEADAFKRKVEREIDDGLHVAGPAKRTVEAVADDFLKFERQRRQDGRIGDAHLARTEMVMRKYVKPELGSIPISDLSITHVEALYRMWTQQGWKPRTARDNLHPLHYLERFAKKRGWTAKLVTPDVLADLRGMSREKVRTLTPEEAGRVLSIAGVYRVRSDTEKGVQHRSECLTACFVYLAAFCGLRYGEILALPFDSIDFDRKRISIKQSMHTPLDQVKPPKSKAGYRTVPLPDVVAKHLRHWTANYAVQNPRNLVFRSRKGGGIYSNVQLSWQSVRMRAGIDDEANPVHFHALRHFYASWLIRNNVPVTDVAELLGHSHFDMTLKVYAHPMLEAPDRAAVADTMTQLLEVR